MARRRSRRRKNSYGQDEISGYPPELVIEDLSPRARRLVESGVIDLSVIAGSGEKGRITSGDILHAARVMEVEQSVARIEAVGWDDPPAPPSESESSMAALPDEPEQEPEALVEEPSEMLEEAPDPAEQQSAVYQDEPIADIPRVEIPEVTDAEATSAMDIVGEPVAVPPNPWEAYNGTSEGLAERSLPGAEQSWGEAEANIAAIAEEAAAQIYGRAANPSEPPAPPIVNLPEAAAGSEEPAEDVVPAVPVPPETPEEPTAVVVAPSDAEAAIDPEPEVAEQPAEPEPEPEPEPDTEARVVEEEAIESDTAVVETPSTDEVLDDLIVAAPGSADAPAEEPLASLPPQDDVALEPEVLEQPAEPEVAGVAVAEEVDVDLEPSTDEVVEGLAAPAPVTEPADEQSIAQPEQDAVGKAMIGFGTLETVDPESVWAEGAEYFAPWFLAHSGQLGEALGLEAGLSDARQFTTKSATGVLGLDDNGEEVVVVSTENAVADDTDLGRALGMVASSGAATVALVSAKFHEEQLRALEWLNSQSKSGVLWYAIEMTVVRIADSPAAMMFDLVASPPQAQTEH